MKKSEKIFFVQDLTEQLKEARGIVLVDYQGLTVPQINKLRDKIKQAGASLEVVKNRLLKRALISAGLKVEQQIREPTALILTDKDEIGPLKAILEFARQFELPKFKFGFLEASRIDAERLTQLAQLPSRDQLLAQLAATLTYPTRKLVYNLNFNKQRLFLVLKSIKSKKISVDQRSKKGGEK